MSHFKPGMFSMALIYATKKLLERAGKWDTTVLADGVAREGGLLASWYDTYAIVETQHVVVLVNN